MLTLNVVTHRILPDTDPLLRTTSSPVTEFGDELREIAREMAGAMLERNGLGLAAVQIGRPVRLVLVRDGDKLLFMANPVITRKLRRDAVEREGCLSVAPVNWKRIARPAKCEARWQDLSGAPQAAGFSGMIARAVQHEVEHLDGILITDHPRAA
jgi:peptide deformylase